MPLTKVSAGVIAANAVQESVGSQSITGDKIGLGAITGNTLASNIINANNIVGASITGDKLGLTAINANNIVNASITGDKIALGTITGDDIATGQITANLFSSTIYASNSDIFGVSANANTFGNNIIIVAGNTSIISVGDIVSGSNLAPGTVVTGFNSPPSGRSNITISNAAAGSNTNTAVSFYSSTKVVSPGIAGPGLCKAWVNFNGTGSVLIRAAYNVSSITDNGTGSYTVNFTNAMPDVNYSVAGGAGTSTASNGYRWLAVGSSQASDFSMLTTSVRVQSVYDGTNKTDAEFVSVAIFR
jgi:hypothetical protein